MSLLQQADRLNTANQLNEWNKQAFNSMKQAKQCFININTQKEAMVNNSDYTEDDINEVNAMLLNLTNEANSLIN